MPSMTAGLRTMTIEQMEELVELRGGKLISRTRRIDRGRSRWNGASFVCQSLGHDSTDEVPSVPDSLFAVEAAHGTLRTVRDRRVLELDGEVFRTETIIHYLTLRTRHVVCTLVATDPDALLPHATRLSAAAAPPDEVSRLPILFRNGTGAVVAHETLGHPSELAPSPMRLAFEVHDQPGETLFDRDFDDVGNRLEAADLGLGEQPRAFRASDWRQVPIRRMTNLVVTARDAARAPMRHLAIDLIESATVKDDVVHLRIAGASVVDETTQRRTGGFTLSFPRYSFADFQPASIETSTYPGVVCSAEGQRAPVGSRSIDLLFAGERSIR